MISVAYFLYSMRAKQVFFSFFAIAWLVGLAGCSGIGTSVGISVPIGRAGGVGVSVGSGGAVSGSVGVGSGGGSVSVGTSGQLPKKTEPGEEKKEDNK
jgi:hypothetical protein